MFKEFGRKYLKNMERLFGNYHYIACDPFHESTPPKLTKKYLNSVGQTINSVYEDFDKSSVWVMQAWTMRKDIALAVDKSRLLILDLNSEKTPENSNMWGYPVVSGMLHNFGGKKLGKFGLAWGKAYRDCDYPIDKDITVFAKKICRKYEIN